MRHDASSTWILAAITLVMVTATATVSAQRDSLRRSQRISGSAVTRVFEPAVEKQRESIVFLQKGGETLAFGTVISKDGLVVVKASEYVAGATIETRDGREHAVQLVGDDADNDVAVLAVTDADGKAFVPVTWSDAKLDTRDMGRWVVSPIPGRNGRLKVGVVSARRRKIDRAGGVLGVNLGPENIEEKGVTVVRVAPNSAAATIKLMIGDVITHVNDESTPSREMLVKSVSAHAPGETIRIKVRRGTKSLEFEATLGHRHGTFAIWDRNLQLSGPISQRAFGFDAVIQHDTTLGPRQMGGPLFDLDGKAVGINIARVNRSETFALPADIVRPIIARLIASNASEAVSTEAPQNTSQ